MKTSEPTETTERPRGREAGATDRGPNVQMLNEDALAELLVRERAFDESKLAIILAIRQKEQISLTEAIARMKDLDETRIVETISRSLHLDYLGDTQPEIPCEVVSALPAQFCRKWRVVPVSLSPKYVRVAIANPMDYATIQDVEFLVGRRMIAVVATEKQIQQLVSQFYPESVEGLTEMAKDDLAGEVEDIGRPRAEIFDAEKLALTAEMPPVVRLLNLVMGGAAKAGASDIHFEPKENSLRIRYRVDGLLKEIVKIPRSQTDATISRIKVLSGMDISDRRRPQDGRTKLRYGGRQIDMRVSSLPTQFGEKIVIRLLDNQRAQITMDQLGMTPENEKAFKSLLSQPQGMILVTGPTGSGKSSTLYTALNWVKSPTKNIITVEDPIEYQLEGINQVQINVKAGVTFASGLRSILRQDPNIILVGEVRDQETADIAFCAAQTGHLLLSTLHTNDAPSAITRLIDLGIEPFLISSALLGVLAQRLVRVACPHCKVAQAPSAEEMEKIRGFSGLDEEANWVASRGCPECSGTGFKGRRAIHELLVVDEKIREMISRRASEQEIRRLARRRGMHTFLETGIRTAVMGLTTLAEVARVVASEDSSDESDRTPQTPAAKSDPQFQAQTQSPAATVAENLARSGAGGRDAADSARIGPAATLESAAGSAKGQTHVLVVEDCPTVASVVRYFLELEGFSVQVATNGESGLVEARKGKPDVIISDYAMPGLNGVQLLRELRAHADTRDIAVIMLTSDTSLDRETDAFECGANDFLQKPVEPRRLAARVKAVLSRKQLSGKSSAEAGRAGFC